MPRTFDEHLKLFSAFAVAVSSFDEAAWNRIRARCVTFSDESVFAAFERARIRALPYGFPGSRLPADLPLSFRVFTTVVAGVSTVVQTGLSFSYELTQLFPEMREAAWSPSKLKNARPELVRYAHAHHLLDSTLDSLPGPSLGVRAAIQAAGAAVQFHDFLEDEDFARCYAVVAAEISFADLEHRAIIV